MRTNDATYTGSWEQYHGEYQVDLFKENVGPVQCDSLQVGRRTADDFPSFDRSCVGNPHWIKVGVSVAGRIKKRHLYDIAQSNVWNATDYTLSRRLRPAP